MYPPARVNGQDNSQARAAYWQRQIDHAVKLDGPFHEARENLEKQYYNEAATQREEARDTGYLGTDDIARVKPSIIFGFIDQAISNGLSRNPKFKVTDTKGQGFKGERFVSGTINNDYELTMQKEEDERITLDAYFGWGVKKIGIILDQEDEDLTLDPDSDIVEDDPRDENEFLAIGDQVNPHHDQDHNGHNEIHGLLLSDPDIPEEIKEDVIKPHMRVHDKMLAEPQADANTRRRADTPYGERWNPRHFVMSPLSQRGLADARWIAWRISKPIDEVRANPNYKKSAVSDLKPSRFMENVKAGDDNADEFGLVDYWEVWARNVPMGRGKFKDLLVVIALQGDNPSVILRHDDEWPYDSKAVDHYAALLTFHRGVDTWKAPPMLKMAGAGNIQKIQNEMLDSVLSMIRKAKNILMYDSNVFKKEVIDAVLRGGDMSSVGVPGLAEDGGNGVRFLPFDIQDFNKLDFTVFIKSLMDDAAGTPQPVAKDLDSATEANIVNQRTSAREAARQDKVDQMQIETARKFWSLRVQFGEDDDFVFDGEAGEDGTLSETERRTVRWKIDVGSSISSQNAEVKKWQDLLNIMAGVIDYSIQKGVQPPRIELIAEMLMEKGYDIANPAEIWPAIGQEADEQPGIEEILALQQVLNQNGSNGNSPNGGGPGFNGPTSGGPASDGRALNRPARDDIRQVTRGS